MLLTTLLSCVGPNTPPRYCRSWKGVQCDNSLHVISLDVSLLGLRFTSLTFQDIITAMNGLKYIQKLVIAGSDVTGTMPAGLTGFAALQHLNVSNNPGIIGALPTGWAALTKLQVIDVSSCGLRRTTLPPSWAALQQLRVFRAVGSGISGSLPTERGLLSSLTELDVTGNGITGPLPGAWGDYSSMQSAAKTALAAAQAAAVAVPRAAVTHDVAIGWEQAATVTALLHVSGSGKYQVVANAPSTFLTKLKVLRLAGNQFIGSLPVSFVNLPSLVVLDVSVTNGKGNLVGSLPWQWSFMKELQVRICGDRSELLIPCFVAYISF